MLNLEPVVYFLGIKQFNKLIGNSPHLSWRGFAGVFRMAAMYFERLRSRIPRGGCIACRLHVTAGGQATGHRSATASCRGLNDVCRVGKGRLMTAQRLRTGVE